MGAHGQRIDSLILSLDQESRAMNADDCIGERLRGLPYKRERKRVGAERIVVNLFARFRSFCCFLC